MTALAAVSPTLLAATLADARTQLAAAEGADIDDHTGIVASHTSVTDTLRRVLWVLNAEAAS